MTRRRTRSTRPISSRILTGGSPRTWTPGWLAKTNPLLRYTPEPNLFVDAIATKVHSDIKFGNGAAEFSHLGEKLQEAYAKELGELHDHQTDDIKDDINKKIAAINEKDAGQGNPISRDQARAMIEQDPELMSTR